MAVANHRLWDRAATAIDDSLNCPPKTIAWSSTPSWASPRLSSGGEGVGRGNVRRERNASWFVGLRT